MLSDQLFVVTFIKYFRIKNARSKRTKDYRRKMEPI